MLCEQFSYYNLFVWPKIKRRLTGKAIDKYILPAHNAAVLADKPISPTIPVTDLKRSREFYEKTLGLSVLREAAGGILFQAGKNTSLYIYKRGPSTADHTLASFLVEDVEAMVDKMVQKGIVFEQYDFPGLKTNEKGIAVSEEEGEKGAWFKDPDGNILAIAEEV